MDDLINLTNFGIFNLSSGTFDILSVLPVMAAKIAQAVNVSSTTRACQFLFKGYSSTYRNIQHFVPQSTSLTSQCVTFSQGSA